MVEDLGIVRRELALAETMFIGLATKVYIFEKKCTWDGEMSDVKAFSGCVAPIDVYIFLGF